MGKSGGSSWLNVVKKAFRSPTKDNNNEKMSSKRREEQDQEEEEKKRGKRRWIFRKPIPHETTIFKHIHHEEEKMASTLNGSTKTFDAKSEQQRSIAVAMATAAAAEAAVATARAAAEIILLMRPNLTAQEHHSAVLIQTAFRGYLARRALRALKGVVKLQALVRGYNVRKQAKMTLQYMKALMRVQDRVCNQRKRLSYGRSLISISTSPKIHTESYKAACKRFTSGYEDTSDDGDNDSHQYASKREISLAHAFSQQMWRSCEDQISVNDEDHARYYETKLAKEREEISRSSCDESVKIVEIDTIQSSTSQAHQHRRLPSLSASSPRYRSAKNPSFQSPMTPSHPCRAKPLPHCLDEERSYSAAPQTPARYTYHQRVNQSENYVAEAQPKYMAATASANARARSVSAPRQRTLEKKRLSFADIEANNDNGTYGISSLHSILRNSSYVMDR